MDTMFVNSVPQSQTDTILNINEVIPSKKILFETPIFTQSINAPNLWNTDPGILLTTIAHYTLPAPTKNVFLGKINLLCAFPGDIIMLGRCTANHIIKFGFK
jgi:hypothetical protein